MIRLMAVVFDLSGLRMEEGDLSRMGVSLFLGIFIISLLWSLSSEHRSGPPF